MELAVRPGTDVAAHRAGAEQSVAERARCADLQAAAIKQRHLDQQTHHHSQIWTKGAHDGPYRKVSCSVQRAVKPAGTHSACRYHTLSTSSKSLLFIWQADITTGYDALLQTPDGQMKAVQPGYEQPQAGPTTNFVGNHMTQGAVDLVQMQLQRREPMQLLLECSDDSQHLAAPLLLTDTSAAELPDTLIRYSCMLNMTHLLGIP